MSAKVSAVFPESFRKNSQLMAVFAVVAILFSLPVLENINNWGIQDWDGFLLFDGLIRNTVLQHGQIPLWDPFLKGGMPMLAYSESNVFSPALLVQLLFNEVWAAKINIVLHVIIGLAGTYALELPTLPGSSASFR